MLVGIVDVEDAEHRDKGTADTNSTSPPDSSFRAHIEIFYFREYLNLHDAVLLEVEVEAAAKRTGFPQEPAHATKLVLVLALEGAGVVGWASEAQLLERCWWPG